MPAHSDSWLPPEPIVTMSRNGKCILRITPSDPKGGAVAILTKRIQGMEKILWRRRLINRVSPASGLVSDNGHYVVTFDNWNQIGYGPDVIVVYGSHGELLHQFGLEQLMSPEEIRQLGVTASSRRWRRGAYIGESSSLLYLEVSGTGKLIKVDLARGLVLDKVGP